MSNQNDTTARDPIAVWPELTLSEWEDTRDTLHMWTQIVGKVRMAVTPMVNHWWNVTLYVSARGLTTSLMHRRGRAFEIEFDFIDHVLDIRTADGERRHVALEPRTVADFYAATMGALDDLGMPIRINPRPQEVLEAIPFPDDSRHASYDAAAANRFWNALVHAERVMSRFRAGFNGKVSPIHHFWGGNDLAVTRFSGRTAPKHPGGVPNCPDWVQELAYSHEVSSCGFWPGGGEEGAFYAYAYPEPEGFGGYPVQPDAAFYSEEHRQFLLPYEAVRTAHNPDQALSQFLHSTYAAAAELGDWDRTALEDDPHRLPRRR
jgi:hypothetical protein